MAQAARKHVLQNFNMTRSIEKYHELYVDLVTGEAPVATNNAEAEAREAAQSLAAAEIITNRAATTMLRNAQTVAQPTTEKSAPVEPATGFGSVQQVTESIRAMPSINAGFVATAAAGVVAGAETNTQAAKAATDTSDTIDFDALATARLAIFQPKPVVEESSNAAEPWSEDDAHLLDEILVEADAETAKANADKAANAAKSSATKAAANAALAAALAGNPEAAKTLDPKMLAAALNLSGASGSRSAPRAVAGKAPPPPSALAPKPVAPKPAAPKPESPPSLTVVKTGSSTAS